MQYEPYLEGTIKRFDRVDSEGRKYKEAVKQREKFIVYMMKADELPAGDVWYLPLSFETFSIL